MKILMVTNTYLPHVGGVANSVASFVEAFRAKGHRTGVLAPHFEGAAKEEDVIRLPAIQRFNGSDFAYRLPAPWKVIPPLDALAPDIVHSHHPFLLGDTAIRIAVARGLPLVFTHHTMYERYTHYVPGDSDTMRRFVVRLATEYANLCDHVIAPSESIARELRRRGVQSPISAVPTGIDQARFAAGDGAAARRRWGIPPEAFVVGHVGRLAPEKNLAFLVEAAAGLLAEQGDAHLLIVGGGPMARAIRDIIERRGLADRLHMPGSLRGQDVIDAYHAMDVFAFASLTETQGMVVAEAMAAGVPVVGVDAPGVREVVRDRENGRLLDRCDLHEFAAALAALAGADAAGRRALKEAARATAERFSLARCANRLLAIYAGLDRTAAAQRQIDDSPWTQAVRLVEAEWNLWLGRAGAAVETLTDEFAGPETRPTGSS